MKRNISKTFNLRVTSGYLYSLELGTTLSEDVEIQNTEQALKEEERIATLARTGTKKDASIMLQALKVLVNVSVAATDSKAAEANQNLKALIVRLEIMGIK
jgi:hypothetical protein